MRETEITRELKKEETDYCTPTLSSLSLREEEVVEICGPAEVRRCRFIDADAEPDAADGPVRAAGDSRVFDGIELIVDARGRFPAAILGSPALFLRDELWGAPDARFLSSRSPRFSVWTRRKRNENAPLLNDIRL